MIGADVAGLRGLALFFDGSAARLGEIERSLSQGFYREVWRGSDAQDFRGYWDGSLAPSLRAVQQSLADAAVTLRRNADDQEKTSNDLSGASTTAGTDLHTTRESESAGGSESNSGKTTVSASKYKEFEEKLELLDKKFSKTFGDGDALHAGESKDAGGSGPDVSAKMTLLEGEWGLGKEVSASGSTNVHGVDLEGEVKARAGAFADGEVAVTQDGLTASGQVMVGASASATGSAIVAGMTLTGEAKGTVGAIAEGEATLGKEGVKLSGEAFTGAKVEGSASAEYSGVKGTLNGEAWVGYGASLDAGLTYEDGKFKVEAGAGAAAKVGFKVGGEIEIDVNKTVDDVIGAAKSIDWFFD